MTYSNADFTPGMKGYSDIKPFRFWCQKVLPLVYDDSLSYYELLCRVTDYINNIITDLATTEENVGALLDAYNQLQDYVNNYFTNLDVQEEINNKLDDLVEDGTLTRLIGDYVQPYLDDFQEQMDAYETQMNGNFSSLQTATESNLQQQNNKIAVLEGRMDTFSQLTPGSTTGDAELQDIRVAYNGTTYQTAGDAVRAQARDLNNALINAEHEVNGNLIVPIAGHEIIQGSFDLHGDVTQNSARIRTSGTINMVKGQKIKFKAGTNVKKMLYGYRTQNVFASGAWLYDGDEWTAPNDREMILVFTKEDDTAEIAPSDYDAQTEIVSGFLDDLNTKVNDSVTAQKALYENYLIDESTFDLSLLGIDEEGYLYRKETLPTTHNNVAWCERKNDISNISTKVKFSSSGTTDIRIFFEMSNGQIMWMNFSVTNARATGVMFYDWNVNSIAGVSLSVTPTLDTEHILNVNFIGDYVFVYLDKELLYSYNFISSNMDVRHICRIGYGFRGSSNNSYFRPLKFKGIEKFVSISFDDQLDILQVLTQNANAYTSLFECPGFDYLLDMHNQYGCTFTLNLFRQVNATNPTFLVENTTKKFKSEFIANSSWLKFSYHGPDGTTYPENMSVEDLLANVQTVYNAITNFAGSKSIDRVSRMSMFNCTHEQAVALRNAGLMVGFMTADDTRTNNTGLSGLYLSAVQNTDYCIDYLNDIRYFRTSRRFDNYTLEEILANLNSQWNDPNNNKMFVLFSHGFVNQEMQTKLSGVIEWISKHGISYKFPQNVTL